MIRFYTILLLSLLLSSLVFAQVNEDSLPASVSQDTTVIIADTTAKQAQPRKQQIINQPVSDTILSVAPAIDSSWKLIAQSFAGKSFKELSYSKHPYFAFNAVPFVLRSDIKQFEGKELMFYAFVGLLLLFAFLKTLFAKYISDLFRLFFRRTLKQRQISEQLSQTPLPSLIFNIFFIITGGLYLSFVLQHSGIQQKENFWLLALYCAAGLGIMYILKFLSLKFIGWVLNVSQATDAYIFIVFIINKVIGIFLLPFIVLLAFTEGSSFQIAVTLSWIVIPCLYLYRFVLSYSAIHNQIKIRPFHFLVYLIAFEIVPLLLIYKLLFLFLA